MWCGVSAVAQTTQIATLFHDGTITNFTSATGLTQALDAAVDGDVITLSSGLFQAADITKNVTIRGAGMGYPELGGTPTPTILSGNFKIDCPDSNSSHLYLEGLVNSGIITILKAKGFSALKCQFSNITHNYDHTEEWHNFKFIHCIINVVNDPETASLHFVNCAIKSRYELSDGANRSRQFDNCVIYTNYYNVSKSNLTNSVLFMKKQSAMNATIDSSSSLNHCIIVGCTKYNAFNGDNKFYTEDQTSQIFTDEGLFNLTDTAKELVGTDGGEVGIHGGSLPFTPVTTNLKINKFKVAERTTADGKLPVEINIESN